MPGLLHKSEAGGVASASRPKIAEASERMAKVAAHPGSERASSRRWLSGGVEALVGLAPSPLGRS